MKVFNNFLSFLTACTLLAGCAQTGGGESKETYEADIVVYGGTAAAITAAIQATKMNKSVIVVSPDKHLGGLTAGGLGFTDTGNKEVIGGLSREFHHRLYLHYDERESWKWQQKWEYGNEGQGTPAIGGSNRTMWIFEPHAAEEVFEDLAREYKLTILRDEWLDRDKGTVTDAGRIISFRTLSGKTFKGKMFL